MTQPHRVKHPNKAEETPSEASNKAQAQARRQRACGVKGQSPLRSLRQSLNRRKPTSGAERKKKNVKFSSIT